jgi:hypothetical protein
MKLRFDLLEPGEDIREDDDEPSQVQRLEITDRPGFREPFDREQDAVLKHPGLPARLIGKAECNHDGEEACNRPTRARKNHRQPRQSEKCAVEYNRRHSLDWR